MCLLGSHSRRAVFALLTCHGTAERALRHLPDASLHADSLVVECQRQQINAVGYYDDSFPVLLREIPDPPLLLYFRGELDVASRQAVAIVGSRRCTASGVSIAEHLAGGLAGLGLGVVSGLARGIDSAAHRGALLASTAHGGKTIAVLGSGIGRVYPSANRALAREIVARGGLLLSEYAPFVSPQRYHFPERNRLISGISLGVVVVEASERSGSLITARLGLEQGREVMAVPGQVGSANSPGCHRLLKQGAALIEDTRDVVEALGLTIENTSSSDHSASQKQPLPDGELRQILELVRFEPTTLDEILDTCAISTQRVAAYLVELELDGFVQRLAEGYIRRPFG
ncbi:MAG: DNA-processing protein DprA [Gammaproteobacteria bacterium]|nr:DNA-processing protein DprA [Gammaproteobacteria bacterium]